MSNIPHLTKEKGWLAITFKIPLISYSEKAAFHAELEHYKALSARATKFSNCSGDYIDSRALIGPGLLHNSLSSPRVR